VLTCSVHVFCSRVLLTCSVSGLFVRFDGASMSQPAHWCALALPFIRVCNVVVAQSVP
jgi:hypothetical protein